MDKKQKFDLKEIFEKVKNYFKETLAEMRKVVWPNRRYVTLATFIVLIIVLIAVVAVLLIDLFLAKIFGTFLKV